MNFNDDSRQAGMTSRGQQRKIMQATKDYINLLPREEKRRSLAVNVWTASAVLFVLAWVVLFATGLVERRALQEKQAVLSAQKQGLYRQLLALQKDLGISSAAGTNLDKVSLIKALLGERVLWSEVFRQFSRIVPQGLWFDSLEGNTSGRAAIKIRGGAFNYTTVSEFLRGMDQSGYFETPQLIFAQKAVVQGREVVAFEVISGVKRAGGGGQ
jgi:Tfp pilus assembly protein PilN